MDPVRCNDLPLWRYSPVTSTLHTALRLFVSGTHSVFSFEWRQPAVRDRQVGVSTAAVA